MADYIQKINPQAGVKPVTGNGSPEGIVVGFVGRHYINTANNDVYFKFSGDATNTGWTLINATGGGGSSAVVGAIVMAYSATLSGHLLLNGATYSSTTYPNLFAYLQTTTLPDFRGYFIRGAGTNSDGTHGGTLGVKKGDTTALPTSPFFVGTAGGHTHSFDFGGSHYTYIGWAGNGYNDYLFGGGSNTQAALGQLSQFGTNSSTSQYPILSTSSYATQTLSNPAIATSGGHSHNLSGGDSETAPSHIPVYYFIRY